MLLRLNHKNQPTVLTLFVVVWRSSVGRWCVTFLSFTDLSHTWLDEHTTEWTVICLYIGCFYGWRNQEMLWNDSNDPVGSVFDWMYCCWSSAENQKINLSVIWRSGDTLQWDECCLFSCRAAVLLCTWNTLTSWLPVTQSKHKQDVCQQWQTHHSVLVVWLL